MAHRASGFTLLEILTVLFIIGMTSAIVGPNLPLMKDRMEYAINRETLEEDLGSLAYQAFRDNRDLVLVGTFDSKGPIKTTNSEAEPGVRPALVESLTAVGTLVDLPPIAPAVPTLKIPENWQVDVREPIYFFASGFCRGGKIDVIVGRATHTYRLVPPSCAIVPE